MDEPGHLQIVEPQLEIKILEAIIYTCMLEQSPERRQLISLLCKTTERLYNPVVMMYKGN